MKKLAVLTTVLAISACAQLAGSTGSTASDSTTGKLRTCSFEEASNMVRSGSAFSQPVGTSASQIAKTCVTKLMLPSTDTTTATGEATNALQALMNSTANYLK